MGRRTIIAIVVIFGLALLYAYKNEPNSILFAVDYLAGMGSRAIYYCNNDNQTLCEDFHASCTPSRIIYDSSGSTLQVDIFEKKDACNMRFFVRGSVVSGAKDLSMFCQVPLSKTHLVTGTGTEFFEYCEGSFKDYLFEDLERIANLWMS